MKNTIFLLGLSSTLLLSACNNNETKEPSKINIEESKTIETKSIENDSIEVKPQSEVNFKVDNQTKKLAEKEVKYKDYKKMTEAEKRQIIKAKYQLIKEKKLNNNNKYLAYMHVHRNSDNDLDVIINEEIQNTKAINNKNVKNKLSKELVEASINAKKYDNQYNDVMHDDFKYKYTYIDENKYATQGFLTLSTLNYTIKPSTIKIYNYKPKDGIYQWSAEWYNKNNQLGGTTVGYYSNDIGEIRLINNNFSKLAEKQYDNLAISQYDSSVINSK